MSGKLPRVLFLAADCNPQWHSLPALIWEYCLSLSRIVDIHLVTLPINRENIELVRPDNISVEYIDTERVSSPFYRLAQFLSREPDKAMTLQVALRYPSQLFFEYRAWQIYRNRLCENEFDIVHRASPMSPALPSYMAKRCPVPFVVGPVLGGLPWPKKFKGEMMREGEWMNYLRQIHKFLPFYRSTYMTAEAVLAGYPHTVGDLPDTGKDNIVEFSEGGIHTDDFPLIPKKSEPQKTVLFVGRMVPFKQPALLLECFAESQILRKHRLVMIGDGPELPHLKEYVQANNLEGTVTLSGSQPFSEVAKQMHSADIFGFPSIREQGGGVLTIASVCRTPSVVVDYGGPRYRVPDGCGIRIPLGSRDEIKGDLIRALEDLIEDPQAILEMGERARAFASKFYDWEHKAKKTVEVYDWILGKRKEKPNFWEASG